MSLENEFKREEYWNQLQCVRSARCTMDGTIWSTFANFWTTNAILLVALFSSGDIAKLRVVLAIAVVGVFASVTWLLTQTRMLGHIRRFDDIITGIEAALNVPPDACMSQQRNTAGETRMPKVVPVRKLMPWYCGLAIIGWAATAIASATLMLWPKGVTP